MLQCYLASLVVGGRNKGIRDVGELHSLVLLSETQRF